MNQIVKSGPRGGGIAAKPLRQVSNVRELLVNDQAKQQLAAVAAGHMRPERMLRLMANAMRTTPQLGDCDPLSLLGSMMTCASLGVEPNTPLGHAYLIPFRNKRKGITEVQLILGYKGMIDLARRSGHIVNLHGDVVYEGDEFSFEYGSNQHLRHVPKGKREAPVYAYCHAKLTDGEAFTVLPWAEVEAIRDASQGYRMARQYGRKDTPWIAHQHEMAAKTAVRALFKYLPISIEIDGGKVADALSVDEQRVDYSAFALNADAGHQLIDGEPEDESSAEDEAADDVGADPEDEGDANPEPKKPPRRKATAPRENVVYGEPKGKAGRETVDSETGEVLSEGDAVTSISDAERTRLETLTASILGDIDEAGASAVLQFYEQQLDELEAKAPDLHAQIMDATSDS